MSKTTSPAPFFIEINESCKSIQIGYNGSIEPLKDRSDYDELMDIALNSQDPSILKLFKNIPTTEQWLEYKGAQFVEQNP